MDESWMGCTLGAVFKALGGTGVAQSFRRWKSNFLAYERMR
jgi:hypothetical protein